jgi:hypothetical protein
MIFSQIINDCLLIITGYCKYDGKVISTGVKSVRGVGKMVGV